MLLSRLTKLELREISRKVKPDDTDSISTAIAEAYALGLKDGVEKLSSDLASIFDPVYGKRKY